MPKKILYVVQTLPLLTCTFIYREIFDLRELGFEVNTVSMNTPQGKMVSDEARSLLDTTLYLDRVPAWKKFVAFLWRCLKSPLRMTRCLGYFFRASPMKSFRDYARLGYHLIEACYLAEHFRKNLPDHSHSHFITGATSINMFLAELIDVPFSFTMHASAIWIDPIAFRQKLALCSFCVSISAYNREYVCQTYGEQWRDKINVVHCGILLSAIDQTRRLPPRPSAADTPSVTVVAVGQLMIRKGYTYLIEAARILRDRGTRVRWKIVGEGKQRPLLEKLIRSYGLQDVVSLEGAQPHEAIPGYLSSADIFTLPCIIGDDNTRDGIPVALMEAMAMEVPVVSTNIVGLPELIHSGKEGILVEQKDANALAEAIEKLARDPELRRQFGEAGARKIEREFNSKRSAEQLAALFSMSPPAVPSRERILES